MKKNLKRGEKSRGKKKAKKMLPQALERESQKSSGEKNCFRRNQVYARLRY